MTETSNANQRQADELDWYKDAVIYQLHVKSYFDANNDGVGDFAGLMQKLDYIADLGVNTIWLLPFYPSPRRDDGYDIADYRNVHIDYGTLVDVRRFIRAAHRRGLRIVTELVINHTSDQHPWFQRARRAKPGSAARDFYVWSDNDQAYAGTRIIFCDTEKSNWTWDPVAGAYFWHRFYSHQPDLNYDNPQVLKAVLSVMRFWLDMGVDGLRLDAVPYLVEREGTNNENLPETHAVLKQIRACLDAEYPGRMLLAEANQWPEDVQEYFGVGDECHMAFHFPLMPRMYMAIAREDRLPITDIMKQTPDIPASCQWAIFLRNHDELTLEMVTNSERDYLWNVYAADSRARINLGIRRRLAPLLERDRRRIELMNSLLLSLPGTPVIYYGDELGMGDNFHLGDRDGVRTPMQWSPDRNGGFSRADPERLPMAVLMGPLYGYDAVNVEAQQRDPHSLLNWTRRMLAKRQQTRVFGRGNLRFLYPGNRKILAYLRELDGVRILCVANLSNASQPVELQLQEMAGRTPVEMLGGTPFPAIGELPYLLTLPPYGFYWFELSTTAAPPSWHASLPEQMPEYVTLVLRGRSGYTLTEPARRTLEHDVLPQYLARQRWFPHTQSAPSARFVYAAPLPTNGEECFIAEVEVTVEGQSQSLFTPLALIWGDAVPPVILQHTLARARRSADVGLVTDAFAVPAFAHGLVQALRANREIAIAPSDTAGVLRFHGESGLDDLDLPADANVEWFKGEQSNSSLSLGGKVMLKLVRRLHPGVHPEAEMTRRLTQLGYPNAPALLGEVVRVDSNGTPCTLALLHQHVVNQGDAWSWTLDYLKRTLDNATLTGASLEEYDEDLVGYATMAQTIGERLAQLHATLAQPTDDPMFAPERADAAHAHRRALEATETLNTGLRILHEHRDQLDDRTRADAEWLQSQVEPLTHALCERAHREPGSLYLRIHGDFHLGQVLVARTDAYLIDFEGEPARPYAQRRTKATPLRDVAGLLRSFDYVAAMLRLPDPLSGPVRATEAAGIVNKPMVAEAAPQHHREALLSRFLTRARSAFMDGYQAVAKQAPYPWIAPAEQQSLLELALLEKAAYEIRYEAAHRPDWLFIPTAGLAELARGMMSPPAADQEANAS